MLCKARHAGSDQANWLILNLKIVKRQRGHNGVYELRLTGNIDMDNVAIQDRRPDARDALRSEIS